MVIIAMGNACWPMDILQKAEDMMTRWEDELGPLKTLRADLYGPGGRMEGVRKIKLRSGSIPDDVRQFPTHVRYLHNKMIGDEISLVHCGSTKAISSTRLRPPRL